MRYYRGLGHRVRIRSAAAARTADLPVVEGGWAGVPGTDCLIGESYDLVIEGEVEVPFVTDAVQGSFISITDATGVLTLGAPTSGMRLFGKVTAIPNSVTPTQATHGRYPLPGRMWIKLMPSQVATA